MLKEKELRHIIESKLSLELNDFLESNIGTLFSTPFIPNYYKLLKDIDITSLNNIPKLIIAWMAFLSGDHARMFKIMNPFSELNLKNPSESSLYYSLRAFTSSMLDINDALRYAKLSIDIMPEDDDNLYKANGYLTYGQLLSGTDQYRLAAEMFNQSAKIFKTLELNFLYVIGKVNELLNLYKLGEYQSVFTKANEVLLNNENFTEQMDSYWKLINMPLGLCYYDLNKPSLAIKHLNLAKECIDESDLFHMHGMIELYLFKSYYLTQDQLMMEQIHEAFKHLFTQMHYPQIKLLLSMFNIYTNNSNHEAVKPDIELFELEFLKGKLSSYSVVVETLVYLRLKGLSQTISTNDLIKLLESYRYTGNISFIQLTLIQLAELSILEEQDKEAYEYIKEAVELYKQYGISANFYLLPIKSLELIRKLDKNLYESISKTVKTELNTQLLTERECEILNLICTGKTNDEISKTLYLSVGTVKWHINHILSKLNVKNRVQAIEKAKELKILK